METEALFLLSKQGAALGAEVQQQSPEVDDDWVNVSSEPEVKYNQNGFQALKYGIFIDDFKQSSNKPESLQAFLRTMQAQPVEAWINFLLILRVETTDTDYELVFAAIDAEVKSNILKFKRCGLTEKENFIFIYSLLSKKMKDGWFNQGRDLLKMDIEKSENFFQIYPSLHADHQRALTQMLVAGKIKNKMIMLENFSSDLLSEQDQALLWREHTFSGNDLKTLEFITGACRKIKMNSVGDKFWAYSFTYLGGLHPLLTGVEKCFLPKPSLDDFVAKLKMLDNREKESFIAGLKDDTSAFHQTMKQYLQKRPRNSIVQPADWGILIKQLAESLEAKLTPRSLKGK